MRRGDYLVPHAGRRGAWRGWLLRRNDKVTHLLDDGASAARLAGRRSPRDDVTVHGFADATANTFRKRIGLAAITSRGRHLESLASIGEKPVRTTLDRRI